MQCEGCRSIVARLAVHDIRELLLLQWRCVKAWGFLQYTVPYLSRDQNFLPCTWQCYAGFSLLVLELTNLSGKTCCFSYRSFLLSSQQLQDRRSLGPWKKSCWTVSHYVLQDECSVYPACCFQPADPVACLLFVLYLTSPLLFVTESEDSVERENCLFSSAS